MLHNMSLNPQPFEKIRCGKKTIELRLLDEKRRLICPGDKICFTNAESGEEKLVVKVLALHKFRSFAELYSTLPLEKCGYSQEEVAAADPRDMDLYYSAEKQEKYGVVGIEIEIVDGGC